MLEIQSGMMLLLTVVLFVVKAFALVDCVTRAESDFQVRQTLEKKAWLIILGLTVAAQLLFWNPLGLLNLVGTVAALVYLAQLRSPAA